MSTQDFLPQSSSFDKPRIRRTPAHAKIPPTSSMNHLTTLLTVSGVVAVVAPTVPAVLAASAESGDFKSVATAVALKAPPPPLAPGLMKERQ